MADIGPKSSFGNGSKAIPTNPVPTNALSPIPKIVKAKPVATWFAKNIKTRMPKTQARLVPAAAPAKTPNTALSVIVVVAKAVIAPINIIPSTPRFNTPDFSVMSSPVAARSSGVDAVMIVKTIATKSIFYSLSRAFRKGL